MDTLFWPPYHVSDTLGYFLDTYPLRCLEYPEFNLIFFCIRIRLGELGYVLDERGKYLFT